MKKIKEWFWKNEAKKIAEKRKADKKQRRDLLKKRYTERIKIKCRLTRCENLKRPLKTRVGNRTPPPPPVNNILY